MLGGAGWVQRGGLQPTPALGYATPPALGGGGAVRPSSLSCSSSRLPPLCCPRRRGPMRSMTRCGRSPAVALPGLHRRTVADSNAEVSVQMRGIIREKLQQGETPDQIKASLSRVTARVFGATAHARLHAGRVADADSGAHRRFRHRRHSAAELAASRRRRTAAHTRGSAPRTADDERLERELEEFRREGAHG